DWRHLRADRHHPVRREVPGLLQDREPDGHHLGEPVRRLRAEVRHRLRAGLRAAPGDHAGGAARAGDAGVPGQEPQVRDPDQLHRGGDPDPHPRRLQPGPDGRAALSALRGGDLGRPHLRPPAGQAGQLSRMEFRALDLPPEGHAGIEAAGFTTATPIQEAALPVAPRGKDVAGQAQTGTGKTAAFLIATFARLLRTPAPPPRDATAPRALIIAPTRELVVQIDADARLLGRFTGLRSLVVFGGVDYVKQREALREPVDLLIGTPGRLIDYLKQRVWSPANVEVLILDEADRMFDMGFIADIRWILRRLPPPERRQSFLFSATLSFRVLELTYEFMNNPAQITVSPEQVTVEQVE